MKEHVHRPYIPGATIAAIATPPGEGGIAVVRISGNSALAVAAKIFSGPVLTFQSHTAHLGKIIDQEGHCVDEALLLTMLAPRTYTGEDTVEISCHGGSLVTRKVLETALRAGARAALPGEFTFKAFINGKLDLAQAEAVQTLIGAKNELALHAAEHQLEGRLSEKIAGFQHELLDAAAILEAWVDFPEEDLAFAPMEQIIQHLSNVLGSMEHLLETFHEGKILTTGITLCLAGPPNVGKSSLMNALLGKDRAIVTPIAGTTRDVLEEDLMLGDIHVRLMDTAGIRETEEEIEKEGIHRSHRAMDLADVILFVLDASLPTSEEALLLLRASPKENTLLVWNKIDLSTPPVVSHLPHSVRVSAKTQEGFCELKNAIHHMIWKKGFPAKDEVILSTVRHAQALENATQGLSCVIEGLRSGISAEFVSSDMRMVLTELGTIIGTNVQEDILNTIFSKFCVGK